MRWSAIVLVALFTTGCGASRQIVPLLTSAGVPLTQPTLVPLRVVTRSTAVRDPLRLRGTDVLYGDVEATLGHAIASATVPWADAHRAHSTSKEGWQLSVEVTNADAEYDDGRVVFSLAVRATLRARAGNLYLGQTQASCRQGGIVAPDQGAPIVYRCMMEVGRDLAGWLDGVDLDAVATPRRASFQPDT
jgi:hypothetical protein